MGAGELGIVLPTAPENNEYFNLTTHSGFREPGVYKWNLLTLTTHGPGEWELQEVKEVERLPATSGLPENALYRTGANYAQAISTSGASHGGTLVVAGSLSMNIVHNHTEAVLGAGGGEVADEAGTGSVVLSAYNLEVDATNAKATADGNSERKQSSGSSGSSSENPESNPQNGKSDEAGNPVGIGASVALNILTGEVVRAEIENGVGLKGGSSVEVTASSERAVSTNVEAGASGKIGIAPAVSLVVLDEDVAIARIGSSSTPVDVGGPVTVSAVHAIRAAEPSGASSSEPEETEGSATAAGKEVAVGADISINVLLGWSTSAEIARSVTATAISVLANSTVNSGASTKASAKGAPSKNEKGEEEEGADGKANGVLGNNANTSNSSTGNLGKGGGTMLPSASENTNSANSKSSSQSGDSGGGVGIAAAISVNWVVATNNATVAPHITLIATDGPVVVEAADVTRAISKAIGWAVEFKEKSKADIAAAVGLNVTQSTNTASVGEGTTIKSLGEGAGITVAAVTPTEMENDFIVWGLAGAGGENKASIAAAIGVQVISYLTTASVGQGTTLNSQGALTVSATNPMAVQNLALAGGLSLGGNAVGGAITVNVVTADATKAYIESGTGPGTVTTVNAAGALGVTATSSLLPMAPDLVDLRIEGEKLPKGLESDVPVLSSIAIGAGVSSGEAAVTGSVIIDVFSFDTEAFIGAGARVNQEDHGGSGQTITVKASNSTSLVNVAGGLALSKGNAGVGIGVIVDVINTTVKSSVGESAALYAGGNAAVEATTSEEYFELAVEIAASNKAGVAGSVIVLVINAGSGTGTYAEIGKSASLIARGNVKVLAADTVHELGLYAGQVSVGSKAGVGVSSATLVRGQTVDAGIAERATVGAAGEGGLHVSAAQEESIKLIVVGGSAGGNAGVAGSASIDVLTDRTNAHIDPGAAVNCAAACADESSAANQEVAVTASDNTTTFDTAGVLAIGGDAGIGAGVDVQVLGKTTTASIGEGDAINAKGNVISTATSNEHVLSISAGASFGGDVAVTVNAGVSVLSVDTEASIGEGARVQAGDSVNVAANEALTLDVIAGNISGAGDVAVGAAGAVPVINKTTKGWIGDGAVVTGLGQGSGTSVNTGAFGVEPVDPRFNPEEAIEGEEIINLAADMTAEEKAHYSDGFTEGEAVRYDNGGGQNIVGLPCGETAKEVEEKGEKVITYETNKCGVNTGGNAGTAKKEHEESVGQVYYVVLVKEPGGEVSNHRIKLSLRPAGVPGGGTPLKGLKAPAHGGESQRFVGSTAVTTPSDNAPRFDPSKGKHVEGNIIRLPYTPDFVSGEAVIYSSGGGAPIGGLVDGGEYIAVEVGPDEWELEEKETKKRIQLEGALATGRSHSLVKKGDEPSPDAGSENQAGVGAGTLGGFHGVSVTASNSDNLAAVGVSAAISGGVSVALSGAVAVVNAETLAYIGEDAHINCSLTEPACGADSTGATAAQSVNVAAADSYRELAVAASLAIGADVGVAPSVGVGVSSLTTKASVGKAAIVHAQKLISIAANGQQSVVSVVVGVAGGEVGVAASAGVTVLNATTWAYTGEGATLTSAGNVLLTSSDATESISIAGDIAAGYVGVSAGVGVLSVTKDTRAFIGALSKVEGAAAEGAGALTGIRNGTTHPHCSGVESCFGSETFRGVAVQASSSENIFGLAVAIGAGVVGVAGAVNVTLAHVTTLAYVDKEASVKSGGSVDVSAVDFAKTLTIGGGVAGGFVGVGGGIDVGILNETIEAYTQVGSNVTAHANVGIYALGFKEVTTFAIGLAGGFVGVAGGVSVWTIGPQATSTYNEGAGGPDKGEWQSGTAYDKGDVVTYCSGAGCEPKTFAAKIDKPNTTLDPEANPSEWEAGKNALSEGSGGPAASGDQTASGQSGSLPVWTSGTEYKKEDVVTYEGHNYEAIVKETNKTKSPVGNKEWKELECTEKDPCGSPGYTSALNGTSNTTPPAAWSAGTAYLGGEFVEYKGHKYESVGPTKKEIKEGKKETPNKGANPESNPNLWTNVDGQFKTNSRIQEHTGNSSGKCEKGTASGELGCSSQSGIVSGALASKEVPLGTSAEIYGNVHAEGNVSVLAHDELTMLGVAGAVAGGFVGFGAGILVVNIEGSTDAGIGEGASVSAGAASGTVTVKAIFNENVFGVAFAGAGGFVALSGAIAVINDSNSQLAHVDNNASIPSAGGGLTVEAIADRSVSALTPGIAAGAVAAGASVAIVSVSGDDKAIIGDVLVGGTSPLGVVNVHAEDNTHPSTIAISIEAGAGAISGAVAFTDLSGATQASSGAHGSVGAGGMSVTAVGHHSEVTAETFDITTGGLAVGVVIRNAVDDRTTEADTTASATSGAALSTTGAVIVSAVAANHATAKAYTGFPEIKLAGLAISVLYSLAEVDGATRVKLEGSVSRSSSITATAYGDNRAIAPVVQIEASVTGLGGIFAYATIGKGAAIEALVESDASLSSEGAVEVLAKTAHENGTAVANTATADLLSVSFSLALNVTVMISKAVIDGAVHASLDGKLLKSKSLTVKAIGENQVESVTNTVSVSLGAALSGSGGSAEIGPDAATDATAAATSSLASSGLIEFDAASSNQAKGESLGAGGALVKFSVDITSAIVQGETDASVGGNVEGSAAGVIIKATSANRAKTSSETVNVGFVAGGGSTSTSEITGSAGTFACGGVISGGVCTGSGKWSVPGGPVTITATSGNVSTAEADGGGGGAVSIALMFTTAVVGGPTVAGFTAVLEKAGGVGGKSLTVEAIGQNIAVAETDVVSVGVGGNGAETEAEAVVDSEAKTVAEVGAGAVVNVEGAVKVLAQQASGGGPGGHCVEGTGCGCHEKQGACASAWAHGGGGGLISGGSFAAKSLLEGGVSALVSGAVKGSSVLTVEATSNNDAEAQTEWIEVSAFSGAGGGVLAQIGSKAVTEALSGSSSALDSSGLITVHAGSNNRALAKSNTGTGGLGVSFAVTSTKALVEGATGAAAGGGVEGGSSGVSVTATSHNTATATSFVLSIGGLGSGGKSEPVAEVTGGAATFACGGVFSGGACVGSGKWSVPGGPVTVTAKSGNTALAESTGGGGSLGLSVNIATSKAVVGGPTVAGFTAVLEKAGGVGGKSLTVEAIGQNIAVAETDVVSVGVLGTGAKTEATAEVGGEAVINALVGAGAVVNVEGAVKVLAKQSSGGGPGGHCDEGSGCGCHEKQGSCASAFTHGGGGGTVSVGTFSAKSVLEGGVSALVNGSVKGSSVLTVEAGSNNDAEATSEWVEVSLLLSVSSGGAVAQIGSKAVTAALSGSSSALDSSGLITVHAASNNHAFAKSGIGSGGTGISGAVTSLEALIEGATGAAAGGNVEGSANGVNVTATSHNTATGLASPITVGLLGSGTNGSATAEVTSGASTFACGGNSSATEHSCTGSGTWTVPAGAVTTTATSLNTAEAKSKGGSGSLTISVNIDTAKAVVNGPTVAGFTALLEKGGAAGGNSLTVEATSQNVTVAETEVVSVGILGSGAKTEAEAEVGSEALTNALIGAGAVVNVEGGVKVLAKQASGGGPVGRCDEGSGCGCHERQGSCASAYTHGGGGGTVSAGTFSAKSVLEGGVSALVNGAVKGSSVLTVEATSNNDAEAQSEWVEVSLLFHYEGGGSLAKIGSNAVTEALGGAGSALDSNGLITVHAASNNHAFSKSNTGSGSIGIAASVTSLEALVEGATGAAAGGGVKGTGAGVKLTASSANSATSKNTVVTVGLLGSGAHAKSKSEIGSAASTPPAVAPTAAHPATGAGPGWYRAVPSRSPRNPTTARKRQPKGAAAASRSTST